MKKFLTYIQRKDVKNSNYKDSVKIQFETTLAQPGQFPYSTSSLKIVVKETITPKTPDELK